MSKSMSLSGGTLVDHLDKFLKNSLTTGTNSIHGVLGKSQYTISSTDGWTGRAYHSDLKDMLRACVIHFKDSWDDYLPLINFSIVVAFILVFRWPRMRYYVGVDAGSRLVGLE